MTKPVADYLIEVSFSVANKNSGVNTVIASKAKEMATYYGEQFYATGPYFERYANTFKEVDPPEEMKPLFTELQSKKIICHFGRWLVPGEPKVILIDYSQRIENIESIKNNIIEKHGIDVKTGIGLPETEVETFELHQRILWGDSTIQFLKGFLQLPRFKDSFGVIQFHLSDATYAPFIEEIKNEKLSVGMVGTLHSTRLGRAIAEEGGDIFREIRTSGKEHIEDKREYQVGKRNIALHQYETLSAKNVDVLTTVSDVTATEAEYVHNREVEIVTPNGLNIQKLINIQNESSHNSKKGVDEFITKYFSPYYSVNTENALYFFTSGRHERNTKGYEIIISALDKLNNELKEQGFPKQIFVFFFIMEFNTKVKEDIFTKTQQNPPVVTSTGLPSDDLAETNLKETHLQNTVDDVVKIIYYPTPVTVNDGLLNMNYNDVISSMDLGMFPSFYEPWGYTPHEAAAKNIISITTDVAGFGKYILNNSQDPEEHGIIVLRADGKEQVEVETELLKHLKEIAALSEQEREKQGQDAQQLVLNTDWEHFAKYYIEAHNVAVQKAKLRLKN